MLVTKEKGGQATVMLMMEGKGYNSCLPDSHPYKQGQRIALTTRDGVNPAQPYFDAPREVDIRLAP